MSAGVNTCGTLAKVQLTLDAVWSDNAKNKDYIADVEVLRAIRENQTVEIQELNNPQKDKTVTVYWVDNCDETTAACSDDCTVTGSKPGTQCQDYTFDICRTATFSVDEKAYRALAPTFEEAVAKSMLMRMKALDNYVALQAINKLEAGKGVNAYNAGKVTVSGFSSSIPAAYWNSSLFATLKLVAAKNKFTSPYLINGTNLFEAYQNSQWSAANSDGKGAANAFGSMKAYFDLFQLESQVGSGVSYLVNSNALAFHSKAYYNWNAGDARAEKWGGAGSSAGYRYQVESKNLPGVFYDVVYKIACSSNEITHSFGITFNGGIFRNPVGCNPNNTNILKLTCA